MMPETSATLRFLKSLLAVFREIRVPWVVRYLLASCKFREAIYSLEALGLMTNMVKGELEGVGAANVSNLSVPVRLGAAKAAFSMQKQSNNRRRVAA